MKKNSFFNSTSLLGALMLSSTPLMFADDDNENSTNGTGGATECCNDCPDDT